MQEIEIPALPLLVPTAVVVFLLVVSRMRRRNNLRGPRVALVAAMLIYGVGVLRSVLMPYPIIIGSARSTLPPWQVFVQPVPLATVPRDPSGMLLNVLLFIPFGLLAPMLLRRASMLRVLASGFAISLTIEVVQLVGDLTISSGRIADVDDLIGNTTGTFLGCLLFSLLAGIPLLRRIFDEAALRH